MDSLSFQSRDGMIIFRGMRFSFSEILNLDPFFNIYI